MFIATFKRVLFLADWQKKMVHQSHQILLATALLLVTQPTYASMQVVSVDLSKSVATIRNDYISFGWEMEAAMSQIAQLQNPIFRKIASHLSPSTVRIGGISADWYRYTFSTASHAAGGRDHPAAAPSNDWPPFPDGPHNLTVGDFQIMIEFMRAANLSLMFDLNELLGRVCNNTHQPVPYNPGQWCTGPWDTSNVRALMKYVHDHGLYDGSTLSAFELGNEQVSHLDAGVNVQDIITLAAIIQDTWADVPPGKRPALYAPSTDACYDAQQLEIMTNITNVPGVAGYTFHAYPFGSGTGGDALLSVLTNGTLLRSKIMTGASSSSCIDAWNAGPRRAGLELLVTESSSSWSWQLPPPAQNSFLHGMYTIAELGQFALTGVGIMARWSFSEYSPFATIHPASAAPWIVAADYWLLVAHKRLVGSASLNVNDGGTGALVYAACGKAGNGTIVVSAANPTNTTVSLSLSGAAAEAAIQTTPRFEYVFTAPGGDLIYSNTSLLNGGPALVLGVDGSLPDSFVGRYVADVSLSSLVLPPMSQAYFLLLDADAPACK